MNTNQEQYATSELSDEEYDPADLAAAEEYYGQQVFGSGAQGFGIPGVPTWGDEGGWDAITQVGTPDICRAPEPNTC